MKSRIFLSFFGIAASISVMAVIIMGCPFSGTYTRNGNNATLFSYGERVGAATVSGNRMTGTLDGDSFTFTRSTMPPNPFAGTWTGSWDGIDIEIVIGENNWAVAGIR